MSRLLTLRGALRDESAPMKRSNVAHLNQPINVLPLLKAAANPIQIKATDASSNRWSISKAWIGRCEAGCERHRMSGASNQFDSLMPSQRGVPHVQPSTTTMLKDYPSCPDLR